MTCVLNYDKVISQFSCHDYFLLFLEVHHDFMLNTDH